MITLATVRSALGDTLNPANDAARGAVELRGVHISELADPTPFLDGGEMLLTTGIPLVTPQVDHVEYVTRLVDHGISALVIGLGHSLDAIPAQLAETCQEAGLPLLYCEAHQRFLTITRAYWQQVAATGSQALIHQLGAQTTLVREAAKPDGTERIVRSIAQSLGGWAAHVPLHGAPTSWPASAQAIMPALESEVARFARRGDIGAATFPLHGHDVIAFPLVHDGVVVGAFAVGTGRRISRADRHLLHTATAALALRTTAEHPPQQVGGVVGEAIASLLVEGESTAASALSAAADLPPIPDALRVLALADEDYDEAGARRAPDEIVASDRADRHERITAAEQLAIDTGLIRPTSATRWRTATAIDGAVVILVEPGDVLGFPTDDTPARGALSAVTRLRSLPAVVAAAVRRARSAPSGTVLDATSSAGLGRGQVAAEALTSYTRAPLTDTVRAYLRRRGNWEAAARDLGAHRNTVRNRMNVVRDELGLDLDDPDLAAELWIALRDE